MRSAGTLTRTGWMLGSSGVVLVVAGRLLGVLELYLLGATALALTIGSVLYVRVRRLALGVDRELHPPKVHAGTPSRVELVVRNTGERRSPTLELRDGVSGTRGARLMVSPVDPGTSVRAAYRLPTERRGILAIGPLHVAMEDPFGLARVRLKVSGVSELTVYPHIDEVVPVPFTTGNDPLAGAEHPNALGRSGEDFYALRPYVVGDDLRRVHWPSTARHDELQVRQDELPWQGRTTVLLDVRAMHHRGHSIELAISAAASVITAGARRQDLIRLVTSDGTDSGFAQGHAHAEAIMEHLACLDLGPDVAWRKVLDRLARSSTGGALVAFVADAPTTDVESVARLRQRFGSVTIVDFEASSWDPLCEPSPGRSRPGVISVTRDVPFVQAWNRAMAPRRATAGTWRP
jgi:uncharacterized protein (DUF58 family)